MEDAYERLARLKNKDESFSDVIRRITEKKRGNLADCAGLWADWPEKDFKRLEKFYEERRKLNLEKQEKRRKWFTNTA